MERFPLMVSMRPAHNNSAQISPDDYAGFIVVGDRLNFFVRVWEQTEDDNPSIHEKNVLKNEQHGKKSKICVEVSQELADILYPHKSIVIARINSCCDVTSVLVEIQELTEKILAENRRNDEYLNFTGKFEFGLSGNVVDSLPDPQFYSIFYSEAQQIGWDRVNNLDLPNMALQVTLEDSRKRKHLVGIRLPKDYPLSAPSYHCDLPKSQNCNDSLWCTMKPWNSANIHGSAQNRSSLLDMLCKIEKKLSKYQVLWEDLEELDSNTWVLEPSTPSLSNLTRRISIGNHSSITLTIIDPLKPRRIPIIRVMGQDSVITPINRKLRTNIMQSWDESRSIKWNIENILSFTLPPAPSKDDMDSRATVECAICYAFKLDLPNGIDSSIPECICDNAHCNRVFHRECLTEWLRSLPSFRQSFDTLFGSCPYCTNPISVRL